MAKVSSGIKSLIKLIAALLIIYAGYYYISNYHKVELEKFYLKFDTWGITQIGRVESDRKAAIAALSDKGVPKAQRDALENRTVFLGATDKMVGLALGQPQKTEINPVGQQVWIYYFDDYSRPTYLYFEKRGQDWILTKAEKNSN